MHDVRGEDGAKAPHGGGYWQEASDGQLVMRQVLAPIATINDNPRTLARAGRINATESMFTSSLTFNGSVNRPISVI